MTHRNPTELNADPTLKGIPGEHRNVYCPAYALCLDKAVREGWDDWTCRACPQFLTTTGPGIDAFAHSRRRDAD